MDLTSLKWRKASSSTGNGGACVEVARPPGHIAVRDSKDPSGPYLLLTRDDFHHLTRTIKNL
ncbi:DUF397 domain-containing protein [Actinomadura litoris]|uniref:DUF397 domain-containing protein n=1 Tax=Actinomadura litoris TaxID=2678616 RepID=A0A7K1KUZ3_9ACTN|nr:DUF397 domain-containing protein [Actinomadura litoris]MUN35766.1 DUF397 domain-containing protein [Actinomadura litoris]